MNVTDVKALADGREPRVAVRKLELFRVHFMNGYDTLTLHSLDPRYISSVERRNAIVEPADRAPPRWLLKLVSLFDWQNSCPLPRPNTPACSERYANHRGVIWRTDRC